MCHFYWFLKNVSEKFFENCLFCKKCILQKWRQYQFRAVSYRKTCLKMAPNNKLMSEVHSNASQEVIFEMAPFPSDIMQNIYFSLIFRWFSSKNAKKLIFSAQTYNEKTAPLSHSPSLSPRKCQRMLLRHVSFPQTSSIII